MLVDLKFAFKSACHWTSDQYIVFYIKLIARSTWTNSYMRISFQIDAVCVLPSHPGTVEELHYLLPKTKVSVKFTLGGNRIQASNSLWFKVQWAYPICDVICTPGGWRHLRTALHKAYWLPCWTWMFQLESKELIRFIKSQSNKQMPS